MQNRQSSNVLAMKLHLFCMKPPVSFLNTELLYMFNAYPYAQAIVVSSVLL